MTKRKRTRISQLIRASLLAIARLITTLFLVIVSNLLWLGLLLRISPYVPESIEVTLLIIAIAILIGLDSYIFWSFMPKPIYHQDQNAKLRSDMLGQRLATPIEQLPTADNLQEMLSHDGEIPDTAYRKNDE